MKIAVFSDVHANLPALEAVYKHAAQQHPDGIYCLGDLVNQNVWNNEVVEFIQAHNIPCVLGNHDEGIGSNRSKYSFSYGSREEIDWGLEAIDFTLKQVTAENKKILSSFPLKRCLNVGIAGERCRIMLTHGSPTSNKQRISKYYGHEELLVTLDTEKIQVLLIGNTHCAFHKVICKKQEANATYHHVINPGSVGCPKDGSWHACYAMVTIDESKDLQHEAEALQVQFFRLDYDIDKVIKAIRHSPLSIYYAGRLLK
jgi:putative phosphoesterase